MSIDQQPLRRHFEKTNHHFPDTPNRRLWATPPFPLRELLLLPPASFLLRLLLLLLRRRRRRCVEIANWGFLVVDIGCNISKKWKKNSLSFDNFCNSVWFRRLGGVRSCSPAPARFHFALKRTINLIKKNGAKNVSIIVISFLVSHVQCRRRHRLFLSSQWFILVSQTIWRRQSSIFYWANHGPFTFIFSNQWQIIVYQFNYENSIKGVLGIRTLGSRIESADKSSELWRLARELSIWNS